MSILDNFTPEEYYNLEKKYDGLDYKIAESMYITPQYLTAWKRKHGIPPKKHKPQPRMPDEERIKIVIDMQGYPLDQIAKQVMMKNASSVRSWIDKKKREGYLRDWKYSRRGVIK